MIVHSLVNVLIYWCKIEGIIHLVRTENFTKNKHFLPPDTHTYANVSFSENFCVRTKWMNPKILTGTA